MGPSPPQQDCQEFPRLMDGASHLPWTIHLIMPIFPMHSLSFTSKRLLLSASKHCFMREQLSLVSTLIVLVMIFSDAFPRRTTHCAPSLLGELRPLCHSRLNSEAAPSATTRRYYDLTKTNMTTVASEMTALQVALKEALKVRLR